VATTAPAAPAHDRGVSIALWAISVLLALFFSVMGLPKMLGVGGWAGRFAAWGYPPWFVVLVGAGEIVGAVLLLIPPLATQGAAGLSVIMLGAVATHLVHGESVRVVVPVTLFTLLILVAWGRWPRFRKSRFRNVAATSRSQL
jgi:putative oxidoreductase